MRSTSPQYNCPIAFVFSVVYHVVFVQTSLIAITYLIVDPHRDRILDRDRLSDRGSHGVVHTNLIAITYLSASHDLDRLLNRDRLADRILGRGRLADRGSPGVLHTSLIATAYRGPHQLNLLDRYHLADRGSHGAVHTPLIAIALDHQRNRPRDSNLISMTRTLRPSYFNPMSHVPSCVI